MNKREKHKMKLLKGKNKRDNILIIKKKEFCQVLITIKSDKLLINMQKILSF